MLDKELIKLDRFIFIILIWIEKTIKNKYFYCHFDFRAMECDDKGRVRQDGRVYFNF